MCFDFIRTLPQWLLPKQALTVFAGFLADCRIASIKNFLIGWFISRYSVDMTIAVVEDPKAYPCFNDFFIRHLKSASRPIALADIISPVDGVISQLGLITQGQLLQAKGHEYAVDELLACAPALSQLFDGGQFATFYLSPKDYHRIHMPCEGTLREMIYIPGQLFSVQPRTASTIPKLFVRNERLVIFFDTKYGLMAMVLVGAVVVGAMSTVWHGDVFRTKIKSFYNYTSLDQTIVLAKGEEMGHFKLGSTVILLFAKESPIHWQSKLQAGHVVCYGQAIAKAAIK
ncbi:MAG: phosphatidylserine decarboxylase [Legionellales bacterium RIFCSPHIGHO2_12_FULL_42_9]|nr:MAG: phosphatidylserine decarboxylase [Legionellales bacterium RIFCSPHIGHO2_12_FULL_42_9]